MYPIKPFTYQPVTPFMARQVDATRQGFLSALGSRGLGISGWFQTQRALKALKAHQIEATLQAETYKWDRKIELDVVQSCGRMLVNAQADIEQTNREILRISGQGIQSHQREMRDRVLKGFKEIDAETRALCAAVEHGELSQTSGEMFMRLLDGSRSIVFETNKGLCDTVVIQTTVMAQKAVGACPAMLPACDADA